MAEPLRDADVPGWWARLGLPGLFDVHVHFLPPPVMRKVREQFDTAGPLIGRAWPLVYRGDDDERVAQLRGPRRTPVLARCPTPTGRGSPSYLNTWSAELRRRGHPSCLSLARRSSRRRASAAYVAELVDAGTEIFKVHVQVGDFDLVDPLLDEAWGTIADGRHPGRRSTPAGDRSATTHTGPGPMRALLERHPTLTAVIAHLGAPEYAEFLAIAEDHERVHLDTTMAFTDFFEEMARVPARRCCPGWRPAATRCCSARTSRTSPTRTPTSSSPSSGSTWARTGCARVCWHNAVRLFGRAARCRRRE